MFFFFNATDDVITVRSRDFEKTLQKVELLREGNSVQANFKDANDVISLKSRNLETTFFTSISTKTIIAKIGQIWSRKEPINNVTFVRSRDFEKILLTLFQQGLWLPNWDSKIGKRHQLTLRLPLTLLFKDHAT